MFDRIKLAYLKDWKNKSGRKPLVIRGARQVGKTTLVNQFAQSFDFYISLNLEKQKDREIFTKHDDIETILRILFLRLNQLPNKQQSVLLFIDEIQNSPQAVSFLRYFYEQAPEIYVIATGSLLESLLSKNISFPVGRVEYMFMHPFNFEEFLMANANRQALELYRTIPFPAYGYQLLMDLFLEYTMIGGMPEIVETYLQNRQPVALNSIFDSLLITYLDDVEKYAANQQQAHILRHIIKNAFLMAGQRIKFEGFASSNYKSRDVGECFRTLEKTFLLRLVYPTTQMHLPANEDRKKSPKLQVLDTGMINKYAGLQTDMLNSKAIDSVFEGRIAEHIVGQELLSVQQSLLYTPTFWVKEKKQSNAEIDYVLAYKGLLIPLEVKSGMIGRLRSLLEFMDLAPHEFAVRIYSGELRIDELKTLHGKPYKLLNLPIFLTGRIDDYLNILIK